jgi:hypothetical protein
MMVNSLNAGPVAGLTGGFIPSICPPAPTAAQLAAMEAEGGPEGAEAVEGKIKKSEADAKARVEAVEYLGTAECERWPEARKALINALRADPNECVRYAAARALNSGCCCSKPVIEALKICVAGEESDGNPPEGSARVKAAAFSALQNCLMKIPEELPPEVPPPARERERGGPAPDLKPLPVPATEGRNNDRSRYLDADHMMVAHTAPAPRRTDRLERQAPPKTFTQTVDEARKTLFQVSQSPKPSAVLPPGKRTLLHAFLKARQDLANRQQAEAEATGVSEPVTTVRIAE